MRKVYITAESNGKIIGLDYDPFGSNVEIEVADDFDDMTIFDYKLVGNDLVKLSEEEKEEFYPSTSGDDDDDMTKKIKTTLNEMILNVLPEGETLTPDNVPSLLDIVNPATPEESGTQTNPIVVVNNDIAHNGYLYTYGKYYKWNNVIYQCKRTGESEGGTIKLYYTPDQLIDHYFKVV